MPVKLRLPTPRKNKRSNSSSVTKDFKQSIVPFRCEDLKLIFTKVKKNLVIPAVLKCP